MSKKTLLNAFPLFRTLSDEQCAELEKTGRAVRVELGTGEAVENGRIYCILKGACRVTEKSGTDQSVVRFLNAGDTFGVAAVFANDPNISVVFTEGKTRMLCVSRETVWDLMQQKPEFLADYLAFLSDRIAFLNRKISCVTAGTAAGRLARWLDIQSDEDAFTLPIAMTSLAKLLGLGRASLYRAMEELEEAGCISREGNEIRILDRELLRSGFQKGD